jgi:NADP-reducing hydrogenase subunit HndB
LGSAQNALEEVRARASRKKAQAASSTTRVIVGTATCGVSAGARAVVEALAQEIEARKLEGVAVTETGCSGRCDLEPLVQVQRHGEAPVLYFHVTPEMARRIVQQHIQNNEVVVEWVIK